MKKNKLKVYLLAAFGAAWVLQLLAGFLAIQGQQGLYQMILAVSMYAPFLGVLIAKIPLKDMGFQPKFRGNIKFILTAWFAPTVFAVLGAALYFVLFPKAFDPSLSYVSLQAGQDVSALLEQQGMTTMTYVLVTILSAMTFAPLMNMFFALGEEVGWRGYLYKELKEKYGCIRGRIIGGIIWGIWHWPIMFFGYEYGVQYFGYPVLGPLVFCIITIILGYLLDVLYEKSGMIWVPALAHGAINAANWGIMLIHPDYADRMILGPVPIGLISVIPYACLVLILMYRETKK